MLRRNGPVMKSVESVLRLRSRSMISHAAIEFMHFISSFTTQSMNKSSAAAEMGGRLATVQTWAENWRAVSRLSEGRELGPHLTQSPLGRGLPPYQVAS